MLRADQADDLRRLLGTVEDWLLHAGDEARDDLAEFLIGLGWPMTRGSSPHPASAGRRGER